MEPPHSHLIFWSQLIVPALSALFGVLIGGLITSHNQKKDRQHRRMKEQLDDFYAVLVSMRMQIRAKSELRETLRAIGGDAWKQELEPAGNDLEAKARIENVWWPQYEKIFEYDALQLENELIPLYREMLTHMTKHVGLAEPSTLTHYKALVDYVEIWNRYLQETLPGKVMKLLGHEEKKLYPLYDDLVVHFRRLQKELKQ